MIGVGAMTSKFTGPIVSMHEKQRWSFGQKTVSRQKFHLSGW